LTLPGSDENQAASRFDEHRLALQNTGLQGVPDQSESVSQFDRNMQALVFAEEGLTKIEQPD